METLLAEPAFELLSVDVDFFVSFEKDEFGEGFAAVVAVMVLLLVRAHHVGLEESLVGESFVANVTNHVSNISVTHHMSLSYMHLERTLLREYFTALLAHEADIVRPQIVIVQLKFEREGIVAHAAFERSVSAMIRRYMMIQQGNIFEGPVAILAG